LRNNLNHQSSFFRKGRWVRTNTKAKGRVDAEFMNCWEYMKCGREAGGLRADELGVCPTSMDKRLDGVHGGKNGGRACWAVAGSFANRKPSGINAAKDKDCSSCDFFGLVNSEEGRDTWPAVLLLRMLE
jgi:hypothetical protein